MTDVIDQSRGQTPLPKLESWETLLFNTAPHPKSFIRLWVGYALLTVLWALVLVVSAFSISTGDRYFWWLFIFLTLAVTLTIYGFTRGMLGKNKSMIYICNFWVVSFIVMVSILLMKMIHTEVALTREEWWEGYIGLPFSLASIMLFITVFIVSRVVWRIGFLIRKPYSFPLNVFSISLIIVSLYSLALAREWDILSSGTMVQYMFMIFSLISIIYSFFLVSFINHKGGIKYIMTTRRIIVSSDFLKHSVEDHVFDKIQDIELEQSFLGRRYEYGDLRIKLLFVLETRKGNQIYKDIFSINGLPRPLLMKNAIMALISAKERPEPQLKSDESADEPLQLRDRSTMQNARVVSPRVIVTQNIITEEDDTFDAKTAPAPASTNTPENKSNVSTQNWAEPKKNQQVSRPEMKEQPIDKKPATTDKSSNQKSDNTDIEEITKKYDSQTKKKKK